MQLNNLIFHYIDTKQHQKKVYIKHNDKIYNNSDSLAQKFALELAKNFYKRSIQRAKFDTSTDAIPEFEQILNKYKSDKKFLDFSKNAISLLKKQMEKAPLSTGGIVVFGDMITDRKNHFIFIVILNKSEKFTFDENSLDLKEVEILENEKLAVAAFINLDEHQKRINQKHYISFLRGLREIANYFTDFLGIGEDRVEATQQTTELIRAIKAYVRKLDIDENKKNDIYYRLYNNLYDYANNREEISIDTISSLIDTNNQNAFKEFIQSPDSDYNINSTIELLDKNRLKRLKSFKFRTIGLSISFDIDRYNFKVENDKIILDNPPDKLIEELKRELEDE